MTWCKILVGVESASADESIAKRLCVECAEQPSPRKRKARSSRGDGNGKEKRQQQTPTLPIQHLAGATMEGVMYVEMVKCGGTVVVLTLPHWLHGSVHSSTCVRIAVDRGARTMTAWHDSA